MHAIDLIAPAIEQAARDLPSNPSVGICCVTGAETLCVPRKQGLLPSFTNQDVFRAPQSDMLGVAAYRVLTFRPERTSSWFCDGRSFAPLTRSQVREKVVSGLYGGDPWAGYVTTSYKKHGSLWAVVNHPPRAVWRFEALNVDCSDHGKVLEWWQALLHWQSLGLTRPALESLSCPFFQARKLGAARYMEFISWARPIHQAPLYRFLCYLLPSKKELEENADTRTP